MVNKQYQVPADAAIALLDITHREDGDFVHTFRDGGVALIGADWELEKATEAIKRLGVEEAGPMAQRMRHALILTDEHGPLFLATIAPYERPSTAVDTQE